MDFGRVEREVGGGRLGGVVGCATAALHRAVNMWVKINEKRAEYLFLELLAVASCS